MSDIKQLWQSADDLIAKAEYDRAIAKLDEIKKFSATLRLEELIKLKQTYIEVYENNEQANKAIFLCRSLVNVSDEQLKNWAKNKLQSLHNTIANTNHNNTNQNDTSQLIIDKISFSFKTLQDFKEFARENILDKLKVFEKRRKVAIISTILATIIFSIAIYYIPQGLKLLQYIPGCRNYYSCHNILDIYKLKLSIIIFISICFVITIGLWVAFLQSTLFFYSHGFNRAIIEPILSFIDPKNQLNYIHKVNLSHTMYSEIPLANVAIDNSKLFPNSETITYHTDREDCVYGKIKDINIFWSKISVQKIVGYDWLGIVNNLNIIVRQLGITNYIGKFIANLLILPIKIMALFFIPFIFIGCYSNDKIMNYFQSSFNVGRKPIFEGLFFEATFPKSFPGKTLVTTKNLRTKISELGNSNSKLVKLEDSEFDRIYQVQSTDQVEARYILSTNLMSTLVDFQKQVKRPIKISFNRGKIYIAIAYDYDVFEPRLFKSMLSFAPLKEYFETLQFMLNIVRELNLNRKIWGEID